MIRHKLEAITGPLTDTEFKQLIDLTTTDIRVNRVKWGKRTSLVEMVRIAGIIREVLRRVRLTA